MITTKPELWTLTVLIFTCVGAEYNRLVDKIQPDLVYEISVLQELMKCYKVVTIFFYYREKFE